MGQEQIILSLGLSTQGALSQLDRDLKAFETRRPLKINFDSAPINNATRSMNDFDASIARTGKHLLAFGASIATIGLFTRAIEDSVRSAIHLDAALTKINLNLGVSTVKLKQFGDSLFTIARNTGQSIDEVTKAADELATQGLSMTETLKRTSAALILVRQSGVSLEESIEAITSSINEFKKESLSANDVINRFAATEGKFAVSSKTIAEAVLRVGSSANEAGVSFNQLIALITTASQVTQRDGSVIGTALQQIFNSERKQGTIEAFRNLGITVEKLPGQFLPAIDILKNVAEKYTTLSDAQKQQVAQLVGGTRQLNILTAVLGDVNKGYGVYNQSLQAVNNATDNAIAKNEKLNKTFAAQANSAAQSLQQVAAAVGKLTLGPLFDRTVGNFNSLTKLLGDNSGSQAEQFGAKLGAGILKGIGNALAGPGLVVGGVLLAKLAGQVTKFAANAAQDLLKTNSATEKQEQLTRSINTVLKEQGISYKDILSLGKNRIEQEAVVLAILQKQAAIESGMQDFSSSVARNVAGAGGVASNGGIRFKAEGFSPEISEAINNERVATSKNVGGAFGANPVVIPNFSIGGVSQTVVANDKEFLVPTSSINPRYSGPDRMSIINPSIVDSLGGLPSGAIPIHSKGYTPNFAIGDLIGAGFQSNVYDAGANVFKEERFKGANQNSTRRGLQFLGGLINQDAGLQSLGLKVALPSTPPRAIQSLFGDQKRFFQPNLSGLRHATNEEATHVRAMVNTAISRRGQNSRKGFTSFNLGDLREDNIFIDKKGKPIVIDLLTNKTESYRKILRGKNNFDDGFIPFGQTITNPRPKEIPGEFIYSGGGQRYDNGQLVLTPGTKSINPEYIAAKSQALSEARQLKIRVSENTPLHEILNKIGNKKTNIARGIPDKPRPFVLDQIINEDGQTIYRPRYTDEPRPAQSDDSISAGIPKTVSSTKTELIAKARALGIKGINTQFRPGTIQARIDQARKTQAGPAQGGSGGLPPNIPIAPPAPSAPEPPSNNSDLHPILANALALRNLNPAGNLSNADTKKLILAYDKFRGHPVDETVANFRTTPPPLPPRSINYPLGDGQPQNRGFGSKLSQYGLLASFALPALSNGLTSSFGLSNTASNNINGISNSVATGGAIASLAPGNPYVLALAGAVTALGSFKTALDNLEPSVKDITEANEKYADKQQETLQSAGSYLQAQGNVGDIISSGGTPKQIARAQQISLAAFQGIKDDGLRNKLAGKTPDEQAAILNDYTIDSNNQLNKNDLNLKLATLDQGALGGRTAYQTLRLGFLNGNRFSGADDKNADSLASSFAANKTDIKTLGLLKGLGYSDKDIELIKKLVAAKEENNKADEESVKLTTDATQSFLNFNKTLSRALSQGAFRSTFQAQGQFNSRSNSLGLATGLLDQEGDVLTSDKVLNLKNQIANVSIDNESSFNTSKILGNATQELSGVFSDKTLDRGDNDLTNLANSTVSGLKDLTGPQALNKLEELKNAAKDNVGLQEKIEDIIIKLSQDLSEVKQTTKNQKDLAITANTLARRNLELQVSKNFAGGIDTFTDPSKFGAISGPIGSGVSGTIARGFFNSPFQVAQRRFDLGAGSSVQGGLNFTQTQNAANANFGRSNLSLKDSLVALTGGDPNLVEQAGNVAGGKNQFVRDLIDQSKNNFGGIASNAIGNLNGLTNGDFGPTVSRLQKEAATGADTLDFGAVLADLKQFRSRSGISNNRGNRESVDKVIEAFDFLSKAIKNIGKGAREQGDINFPSSQIPASISASIKAGSIGNPNIELFKTADKLTLSQDALNETIKKLNSTELAFLQNNANLQKNNINAAADSKINELKINLDGDNDRIKNAIISSPTAGKRGSGTVSQSQLDSLKKERDSLQQQIDKINQDRNSQLKNIKDGSDKSGNVGVDAKVAVAINVAGSFNSLDLQSKIQPIIEQFFDDNIKDSARKTAPPRVGTVAFSQ